MAAVVAVDAQKAMSQDAALEIDAHLALDEPGDGRPHRSCLGEEGFEFVADDGVEESLLGLVAFVPVDDCGPSGPGSERERGRALGREDASLCLRRRTVNRDSRECPTKGLDEARFYARESCPESMSVPLASGES